MQHLYIRTLNRVQEVNFTKFLVDKDGQVIKRYGTTTSTSAIMDDIKKEI
ncbi:putative glutathione peroxidase 5 [Castilleja foliolosa]|uniref:Glutathione peroxidase 5 n=1 Tax=Castilleja foliolosa TaxID=1961234 RepID=A0ABD3CJD6_9LAMI